MKAFACILLLAVATAAPTDEQKRIKRGYLHSHIGSLDYSHSDFSHFDLDHGSYFDHAPVIHAPVAKLVSVNKIVEVPKVVHVKKIVSVPKLVSVPKIVKVSSIVSEPHVSYHSYHAPAISHGWW